MLVSARTQNERLIYPIVTKINLFTMQLFDDKLKSVYRTLLKGVCGATLFLVLVPIGALWADMKINSGCIADTTSFTENAQLLLLAIVVFNFVRVAIRLKYVRHSAISFAGFFTACFVRENDELLDNVFHGFWVIPALLVSAIAIALATRARTKIFREFATMLVPSVLAIVAGVVFLFGFTRLFGMDALWRCSLQENYVRAFKIIAEEALELLAYSWICFASFYTKGELTSAGTREPRPPAP